MSYDEHLISMAGGDGDEVDPITEAKAAALEEAAQAWWVRDDVRDKFGPWSWLKDRANELRKP